MSHWISSIIKHCCLLHSKGRLPAPISPSEILLLPSNNLFHPKVVEKNFETVISLCSQCTGFHFFLEPTAQAHTLWFNTPFFSQMWFQTILIYIKCSYHHQIWCVSICTAAWSLLLQFHFRCYWCDIRHRRDNNNQFVTVSLYGLLVLQSEFYTKSIWWHMI